MDLRAYTLLGNEGMSGVVGLEFIRSMMVVGAVVFWCKLWKPKLLEMPVE
jgi:hypothetical protein